MPKFSRVEQAMQLTIFTGGVLFGYFDSTSHNMDAFGLGYALGSGLGYWLIFIGLPWLIVAIIRGVSRFWGDEQNYRWSPLRLALRIGFFLCITFLMLYALSRVIHA